MKHLLRLNEYNDLSDGFVVISMYYFCLPYKK